VRPDACRSNRQTALAAHILCTYGASAPQPANLQLTAGGHAGFKLEQHCSATHAATLLHHKHSLPLRNEFHNEAHNCPSTFLPLLYGIALRSVLRAADGTSAATRGLHGGMGVRPIGRAGSCAGDARRRAPRPRAQFCRQRRQFIRLGVNRRPQRCYRVPACRSDWQQPSGGGSDTVEGNLPRPSALG